MSEDIGRSNGSRDALDETTWQILCAAAIAAHRGDVHASHMATRRFDIDVPVDGRAGTYIWWLLRYRLAQLLGRRPSRGDLTQIAGYTEARFGIVIQDASLLEDLLLTVWRLAPPGRQVTGGRFLIAGVAALGVLLNDPAADLEAVRPDLAAWWQKNLDKFRAQGSLEDRSNAGRRP
jgi:hypothetical protein